MKFAVEYYSCSTQIEVIDAESPSEAEGMVLNTLSRDHDTLGRPTEWVYGVVQVEPLEEEEGEAGRTAKDS